MTKPRITRCGDGHFRRAIYSLGPYIADYPSKSSLHALYLGGALSKSQCTFVLTTALFDLI
jgi:hypothetical protein